METFRTVLSRPTIADFDEIFALKSSEQSRQYLGGPVTKEEFADKFKNIINAQPPESYWVAHQKGTDAFIGLVSITEYHDQNHYEVSYELHPTFWGQKYGTEIIKEVIGYEFNVLDLEELYAETQKKNLASIRLLEKVGMKLSSELVRHGEKQVVYSIQKS